MKKLGKVLLRIMLIFILVICIFLVVCSINHKIKSDNEKALLQPIGQKVTVNGSEMNIYTEGSGETTLVFMSGGGTCSPILDFKALYSKLTDRYKIVVIEKFGYGFSDDTDTDRDVDIILNDTRTALKKSGIEGPYVLLPHSMSGIEALRWAQKYTDEVNGIVGLDMSIPPAYEKININIPLLNIVKISAILGITRFIPGVSESDAIKSGALTDKEQEIYRAVFYKRTMSDPMLNEMRSIKASAKKVEADGYPSVPLMMFSSNGNGTGFSKEEWQKLQTDFAQQMGAEIVCLECSHYVHNYEYNQISEKIQQWVK